jgi:hypothetical protein
MVKLAAWLSARSLEQLLQHAGDSDAAAAAESQ